MSKYILSLMFLLSLNNNSYGVILFGSHKVNGYLDPRLIDELVRVLGLKTFVETGTWTGNTTAQAAMYFDDIHTIELSTKYYQEAVRKFERHKNIHVYQGSSPKVLSQLLTRGHNKTMFWLDAHYSGGDTARDNTGVPVQDMTPIRQELEAIKNAGIKDCVVLIDDMRACGTHVDQKHFQGSWAYPTTQEVCKQLAAINPAFSFAFIGDILMAYEGNLELSPVAQAITMSRLHTNINDEELLRAEEIIAHAQGRERAQILKLYEEMNQYDHPEFHYYLWYGLVCMADGRYDDAHREFSRVIAKGYDHWRMYWYIAQVCSRENKQQAAYEALIQVRKKNPYFKPAADLMNSLNPFA